MMGILGLGLEAVERGLVPDALTRMGIRRLCRNRLRAESQTPLDGREASRRTFVESLREGPIAPVPEIANRQHYELPPAFFGVTLGPRRKYSCCYFPEPETSLADAEEAALALTCQHAELADGQRILDLGCGWGSLSLWMAERFRNSQILAVSNSTPQRQFIQAKAAMLGLNNLEVETADINEYQPSKLDFDRVVSVEMFEHMRNYELLLCRIASWLRPEGKLFVHIFCHRDLVYPFETEGEANWMGQHFFTGGIMPSADLLTRFQRVMKVTRQYAWNGNHYRRTAEAWLANLDSYRDEAMTVLTAAYGQRDARRWFHRWRLFFLAVAELFGYGDGEEWFVSHYLMEPAAVPADRF